MEELKPCSLDTARKWVEQEIHDYCTDGMLIGPEIEAVAALTCIRDELHRRADPENKVSEFAVEKAIQRLKDLIGILDIRISWGDAPEEFLSEKRDYELAISALRNYMPQPENKPLTMEQLRKMEGEPVYSPQCRWGIIGSRKIGTDDHRGYDKKYTVGFFYGWEWLDDVMRIGPLYARKPGGSETGG